MTKQVITKTDFIAYLDAPRHLWAMKHGKLDQKETDAYLEHLFEQGYQVESFAEEFIQKHLIPQYGVSGADVLLQPSQIDEPDDSAGGSYEARTDVLIKNPNTGKWDMYEVKSSTKVDKSHKYDVTFQALVFEKYYDLGDIYILHLNREYIRQGELSLRDLFTAENVNEHVEKLRNEVIQRRYEAYLMAKAENIEAVPECIRPKACPCLELCHPRLPQYSVYDINHITANEKKVRGLVDDGILDVMDVPKDFPLSAKQRFQVDVAQSGTATISDGEIGKRFSELIYPLYFLDYESFNPAIPMYDGYKPYDQMPFQYSLHVLSSPPAVPVQSGAARGGDRGVVGGSKLTHFEFIETEAVDPIPNMLDSLQKVIGAEGSIIVWNKSFEATQNTRMGEIHPRFAEFGENMNDRMFDLMKTFQDQLYADPKFKGSYSIKKVLPVLVPDLSYDGMDIGDGATAMASWNKMVYPEPSPSVIPAKAGIQSAKDKIKQNLLKYCKLDTMAMVRIWEKLINI